MPAFACPRDKHILQQKSDVLTCSHCASEFPIINGVPILINDENSVFRIADYTGQNTYCGASDYGGSADKSTGLKAAYRKIVRTLTESRVIGFSFNAIDVIMAEIPHGQFLVIGSGEKQYKGQFIYTDVAFARNITCICDAHDLPFLDATFDAVIAESVLEHVCDPQRCVAEISRVLKPNSYVMAMTPFLQPVHMGAHDFTRFTFLGHRRLFRYYDEIHSGMCGGTLYSLTHLIKHIMICLSDKPTMQSILYLLGLTLTYPLQYFDKLFSRTDAAFNAGCAFYFLGRKRATPISDRDIIGMFRGR